MDKQQFITRWSGRSDLFKSELNALIEAELAKAQPTAHTYQQRFEAMFRAVYQSTTSNFDKCIEYTKENLTKLDAYYAEKEKGGNNG